MADYDSALPIRTEADGTDERVHVKIVDYSTPAGAGCQTTVSEGNVHVEMHGNDPVAADVVMRLSQLGAPNTDGVYDGTDNTKPSHSGVIAHSRDATLDDTNLIKRVTAVTGTTATDVTALDVAMRDSSGEAITPANPLPVYISESAGGTEVLKYEEETAIAKGDDGSNSYTPTAGKDFALQQVSASASGKMKVEIKIGATGAEAVKVVLFNSTANPNVTYRFGAPQTLDDTMSVVVVLTNLDLQPQNLYSTIEGVEY